MHHGRNEQLRENTRLQLELVISALKEQFQTDPISEQGLLVESLQQFSQSYAFFSALTIKISLDSFSAHAEQLENAR